VRSRERLAELIAKSGLSQTEVARRMGESKNWVNNRLTGYVEIKADEIPRFAAALGVSPCAFFEEVQPQPATVRLDSESIERIGEAMARQRVELAPESIERIAVELAHAVAPATAEAVVRRLRESQTSRAREIARRQTAKLARRWEELNEDEQTAFWEWLEGQKEAPVDR